MMFGKSLEILNYGWRPINEAKIDEVVILCWRPSRAKKRIVQGFAKKTDKDAWYEVDSNGEYLITYSGNLPRCLNPIAWQPIPTIPNYIEEISKEIINV